jgi:hypothetical protein
MLRHPIKEGKMGIRISTFYAKNRAFSVVKVRCKEEKCESNSTTRLLDIDGGSKPGAPG